MKKRRLLSVPELMHTNKHINSIQEDFYNMMRGMNKHEKKIFLCKAKLMHEAKYKRVSTQKELILEPSDVK